jgi:steroid 5-alpha reductase family enzyme
MADASATPARAQLLQGVAAAYAVALIAGGAAAFALGAHGPLFAAAAADVAGTLAVFAFSVAFDNSSVYDPYWSVAPIPLVAYWMALSPTHDARQWAVAALISIWGARLTYNCLARWRTLDHEDFRYRDIRAKTGRWYWPASLASLHLMPTAWVFGGLIPLYPVLTAATHPWGACDSLALAVTAGAIAIEAVADQQLRDFLKTRTSPEAVLRAGLWRVSRHPNYVGEVLFWWGLYLFSVCALPGWPWAFLGPLAITFLFAFISVPLMERRMRSRHPTW